MQEKVIVKASEIGHIKATRPFIRLLTLSILAGAFVGLGGLLSVIIGYGFPGISADNPGLQKLLSAVSFPIGLFLIVMFGADLFTGNNALLIPAMNEKRIGLNKIIVNWSIVWIGNFIGMLIFMYVLTIGSDILSSENYRRAIIGIAETKVNLAPSVIFLRGIGANWCVCLAVWLAIGAESMTAKVLACWIPVAAFVALGYEHCVANMFFIPCGMAMGADISIGEMFVNLFYSTFGNIIGGALMVGHLFHRLYGRRK